MTRIRLATEQEINDIKDRTDMDFVKAVYAEDSPAGGVDLAVLRFAPEIDPVHFSPSSDTRRRAMFIRDIETVLWAQGIPAFYFTTVIADKEWNAAVRHWGAEPLFPETIPHQRYKKILLEKVI